jgi:hypothetical protein
MFSLDEQQRKKFNEWKKEQDEKVKNKQKGTHLERLNGPYYGACAGAYTYSFTPTTLGCVVKVTNGLTKEEIDLTDYDWW